MEGGETDETMGMIPRAIDMIFHVSGQLKDRGWKYSMEGQFLEVYNEVVSVFLVGVVLWGDRWRVSGVFRRLEGWQWQRQWQSAEKREREDKTDPRSTTSLAQANSIPKSTRSNSTKTVERA